MGRSMKKAIQGTSRAWARRGLRVEQRPEHLTRLERQNLAGRDLERLARLRVAAQPLVLRADAEGAEAGDLDLVASNERFLHHVKDRLDDGRRFLLGKTAQPLVNAFNYICLSHRFPRWPLGRGAHSLLDDLGESRGIAHGDVREYLAIEVNTIQLQRMHKIRVTRAVQPAGCVDSGDPQRTVIALVLLAVSERECEAAFNLLDRVAIRGPPSLSVTGGQLQDSVVPLAPLKSTFDSCHF